MYISHVVACGLFLALLALALEAKPAPQNLQKVRRRGEIRRKRSWSAFPSGAIPGSFGDRRERIDGRGDWLKEWLSSPALKPVDEQSCRPDNFLESAGAILPGPPAVGPRLQLPPAALHRPVVLRWRGEGVQASGDGAASELVRARGEEPLLGVRRWGNRAEDSIPLEGEADGAGSWGTHRAPACAFRGAALKGDQKVGVPLVIYGVIVEMGPSAGSLAALGRELAELLEASSGPAAGGARSGGGGGGGKQGSSSQQKGKGSSSSSRLMRDLRTDTKQSRATWARGSHPEHHAGGGGGGGGGGSRRFKNPSKKGSSKSCFGLKLDRIGTISGLGC
ncbi:C-type natriuretic peptide [Lacerta agilis]|uniref:C-type natriuretic peptide n=1 Tax=Lacerta agilis TaxID=80427 RepID=UPI0014196223|nr:C-type natriuretic peptide [Lacerta agilis]